MLRVRRQNLQKYSNKLVFDNCLLDDAITVLEDQYAIGSIEVTVISPVPEV